MSAIIKDVLPIRSTYRGLSTSEAEVRFKEYGPNARLATKQKLWFRRLLSVFGEPMMFLLIATGLVYLFLGDTRRYHCYFYFHHSNWNY